MHAPPVVNELPASRILDPSEKNGLRIFIGKGRCVTCHHGSLLTNQHFHNAGIAPRVPGRRAGIAQVRDDEFNPRSTGGSPDELSHLFEVTCLSYKCIDDRS